MLTPLLLAALVVADADNGFPPWSCGQTNTGSFFITCNDATRVRQWVYCHETCDCQADFQRTFEANCGAYPDTNTQCGTTCLCWSGFNYNPFASNCDCDTADSDLCKLILLMVAHCHDVENMRMWDPHVKMGSCFRTSDDYWREYNDMGCRADGPTLAGVSPGKMMYPPDSCALDLGCDIGPINTGAGNVCPAPPPPIGTTSEGATPPAPPAPAPVVNPPMPVSAGGGATGGGSGLGSNSPHPGRETHE